MVSEWVVAAGRRRMIGHVNSDREEGKSSSWTRLVMQEKKEKKGEGGGKQTNGESVNGVRAFGSLKCRVAGSRSFPSVCHYVSRSINLLWPLFLWPLNPLTVVAWWYLHIVSVAHVVVARLSIGANRKYSVTAPVAPTCPAVITSN